MVSLVARIARQRLPLLTLVLTVAGVACGASGRADDASRAGKDVAPGASSSTSAPAASASARPFASSASEATQLINDAIDKHNAGVRKCVEEYRVRKKMPHERVEISVGIDQEGRLLGATLKKGKPDQELSDCLLKALAAAPFPRSHAGVITMTKTFEEILQ